jgi:hypothetical protein
MLIIKLIHIHAGDVDVYKSFIFNDLQYLIAQWIKNSLFPDNFQDQKPSQNQSDYHHQRIKKYVENPYHPYPYSTAIFLHI